MAVMTLYKRTNELQRWWTTPAAMNLPFSMRSDSLCRWWTLLLQKMPKKRLSCRWWSLISKNAKKNFFVGDEVSIFSASKVFGTTTVTPFPVWCACSLNRKIPFPETSPKTLLAVASLHGLWWFSLTWDSSRNHHDVMSRKKMDPFQKSHHHAECMSPSHLELMCDSHPECTCL